jgi:hypothetical protein
MPGFCCIPLSEDGTGNRGTFAFRFFRKPILFLFSCVVFASDTPLGLYGDVCPIPSKGDKGYPFNLSEKEQ